MIINAKVGSRYLYGAVLFPNIFKFNPSYSKEIYDSEGEANI